MTYIPFAGEEHKARIMKECLENLRYWKNQLRLDHLDILLRWKAEKENPIQVVGSMQYLDYHRGIITLQPPESRTPSTDIDFHSTYEVVLVHELLHMKEATWRDHPSVEKVFEDKWLKQLHEDSLDAVAESPRQR